MIDSITPMSYDCARLARRLTVVPVTADGAWPPETWLSILAEEVRLSHKQERKDRIARFGVRVRDDLALQMQLVSIHRLGGREAVKRWVAVTWREMQKASCVSARR